jgi:hypothetical protein
MRDRQRTVRAVPEAALDGATDHLAEVLRRADQLLAEWSKFGEAVRAQVDREAREIGDAVATAVDGAAVRGVAASVERALGSRVAAVAEEIGRLEARTRAVSRQLATRERRDRVITWALFAGVVVANALLLLLVVRGPHEVPGDASAGASSPGIPAVAEPQEPPPTVVPEVAPPPVPQAAEPAAGSGGAAPPGKHPPVGKTYGAPGKRP